MMTDVESKRLIDLAYRKLRDKFAPKEIIFLGRINRKIMRFKKLNETEEKKLKEIVK